MPVTDHQDEINGSSITIHDSREETDPELGSSESLSNPKLHRSTDEITPLPINTMLILSAVIFSEPMSLTIIFPFVYFMVRDFHISEEKDIGYYVGFIASSFSFAQFITSVFWGNLSDKIGRRPVLLLGLIGNTLTIIMFGMSKSLLWAMATRTCCGLLNGNIGVAKSMLGEITDNSNRGKGFSVIGLAFGVGLIVGPMLGGYLSNPTEGFPFLFGHFQLFKTYPYLLPCLVSSFVSTLGFILGLFYLPETAKNLNRARRISDEEIEQLGDECSPLLSSEENQEIETEGSGHRIEDGAPFVIGIPAVSSVVAYGLLAFSDIVFGETFALWAVSPPGIGLGFSAHDIGFCLSIMGGVVLSVQLFIYPWLSTLFNAFQIYKYSLLVFPVIFWGFPFLSSYIVTSQYAWLTWPLLIFFMTIRFAVGPITFTSVMVMVSNSARPGQLGLVNGCGQMVASFVRAVGPALGGILWAWSIQNEWSFPFDKVFIFFFLSCTAVITAIQAWFFIPRSVGVDLNL